MSTSVRITSDTVDRAVRRVVVGVAVQLVSERQSAPNSTIPAVKVKRYVGLVPTYCAAVRANTCATLTLTLKNCTPVTPYRFYFFVRFFVFELKAS